MQVDEHKCPIDKTPLEDMGHLAPTVFKPCATCGREWYYVADGMASKPRKVKLVAPIVEGARIDDCLKPVGTPCK